MLNPNRYYDLKHRAMAICCPVESTLIELAHRNGTAFRYHDYIITTWNFYRSDPSRRFSVAIYRFNDGTEPTYAHNDITPASLVHLIEEEFDDEGDAVRYGLERSVCLQAERIMKRKV